MPLNDDLNANPDSVLLCLCKHPLSGATSYFIVYVAKTNLHNHISHTCLPYKNVMCRVLKKSKVNSSILNLGIPANLCIFFCMIMITACTVTVGMTMVLIFTLASNRFPSLSRMMIAFTLYNDGSWNRHKTVVTCVTYS